MDGSFKKHQCSSVFGLRPSHRHATYPASLQFRCKRAEDALDIARSVIFFLRIAGPTPLRLIHRTDVVERELLGVVRIAIVFRQIGDCYDLIWLMLFSGFHTSPNHCKRAC